MIVHIIQAIAISVVALAIFVRAVMEPKPLPVPSPGMRAFGFLLSLVILFALILGW